MAEGDVVAVTAIFEKSLKEVEVLQQQIVLKQQLIADLDAEAVVQAPRGTAADHGRRGGGGRFSQCGGRRRRGAR